MVFHGGKWKMFIMSSVVGGIMAVAPMAAHAELGDRTLQKGMADQDVKPLQKLLKGYDYYSHNIDGIFGSETFNAVNELQQDYGLRVDGIFGPETFEALEETASVEKAFQHASPLERGDRGDIVEHLQHQLQRLNYYKGDIDGIFGPLTENAVNHFQDANDIVVDGIAGPETFKALVENPEQKAKARTSNGASDQSEKAATAGRGSDDGAVRTLRMESTAYTSNCNGCSGETATGVDLENNPDAKVVAVDPDVIPLGSKVWVEGYGYAVAADTGGAIDGNKIDVFVPKRSEAVDWGVRTVQVKVYE